MSAGNIRYHSEPDIWQWLAVWVTAPSLGLKRWSMNIATKWTQKMISKENKRKQQKLIWVSITRMDVLLRGTVMGSNDIRLADIHQTRSRHSIIRLNLIYPILPGRLVRARYIIHDMASSCWKLEKRKKRTIGVHEEMWKRLLTFETRKNVFNWS